MILKNFKSALKQWKIWPIHYAKLEHWTLHNLKWPGLKITADRSPVNLILARSKSVFDRSLIMKQIIRICFETLLLLCHVLTLKKLALTLYKG
jgi:hypothetical protein